MSLVTVLLVELLDLWSWTSRFPDPCISLKTLTCWNWILCLINIPLTLACHIQPTAWNVYFTGTSSISCVFIFNWETNLESYGFLVFLFFNWCLSKTTSIPGQIDFIFSKHYNHNYWQRLVFNLAACFDGRWSSSGQ